MKSVRMCSGRGVGHGKTRTHCGGSIAETWSCFPNVSSFARALVRIVLLSSVISRNSRSHRCPQHTDDQRKSVRLLLIGMRHRYAVITELCWKAWHGRLSRGSFQDTCMTFIPLQVRPGSHRLCICLHDTGTKESYWKEFTPVLVPVRKFRTGMKVIPLSCNYCSISTDNDWCAFAPKSFGNLPTTIFRNYEITRLKARSNERNMLRLNTLLHGVAWCCMKFEPNQTSCNIVQHRATGCSNDATCCAQQCWTMLHASCCVRLNGA